MEKPTLPKFDYLLDRSDPDVAVFRREADTFVAAFSARSVTRAGIVEATREDYRALLLEERASCSGGEGGKQRSGAPSHVTEVPRTP